MEEDNNNESKVKETIKNESKKLAKKAVKPFLKYIIMGIICLFGILLAVGLLLVVRWTILNLYNKILSAFSFGSSTSESVSTSANNSVIYIDENTGYYKLKVKDFSKQILEQLEEQKVNNDVFGFNSEESKNTEDSENLEELQDMIDKYIKAEVQTMFPKTGKTGFWQNDDVDGKIIIKRASSDRSYKIFEIYQILRFLCKG